MIQWKAKALQRSAQSTTVAFRSAKVAFFRGAKGDYPAVIDSAVLGPAKLLVKSLLTR